MNLKNIEQKILKDNDFILSELENFLVYYNLKHTLRWGMDNSRKDETESVAEHIYGMHIITDYFLPFYPELNTQRVRELTTWHDMAEAVVDDMTTKTKTDAHRNAETEAEKQIADSAGEQLSQKLHKIFVEYEEQTTPEAKFVKAVDKVEPIFHMYFLGLTTDITKDIFKTEDSGWTMKEYREHREPYISTFPLIWRFDDVMTPVIDSKGFFREWA